MAGLPADHRFRHPQRLTASNGVREVYSYSTWENQTIQNPYFYQSLFYYVSFHSCTVLGGKLPKSDITSSNITNSTFEKTSFSGTAQKANTFRECTLEQISVDSSNIKNSMFADTHFNKINFTDCEVYGNRFYRCTFNQVSFEDSVTTFCEFTNCVFDGCILGNATILYLVFSGCKFQNTSINLESLGYVYGLTESNITSLDFIFLGENQGSHLDDSKLQMLLETYKNRGWFTGYAILTITLGRSVQNLEEDKLAAHPTSLGIAHFSEFLQIALANRAPVDLDDLTFFNTVLEKEYIESKLSLLGALCLHRTLEDALQNPLLSESVFFDLARLRSEFYRINEVLHRLNSSYMHTKILMKKIQSEFTDQYINCYIEYATRPAILYGDLLLHDLTTRYNDQDLESVFPRRSIIVGSLFENITLSLSEFGSLASILAFFSVDTKTIAQQLRAMGHYLKMRVVKESSNNDINDDISRDRETPSVHGSHETETHKASRRENSSPNGKPKTESMSVPKEKSEKELEIHIPRGYPEIMIETEDMVIKYYSREELARETAQILRVKISA